MKRHALILMGAATLVVTGSADAAWQGFVDRSNELQTQSYGFAGTFPDMINSNENYYDGDFGDFDGDGVPDRTLGARYGLLFNTGGGLMTPYNGLTGFLLRGMPGASGWGEDGFQWADVDNDGDLDHFSGGNGEPLTLQMNRGGRFSTAWQQSHSALNIVSTDIEGDGDVDLVVAHAFCASSGCGGPQDFSLLVNDGSGDFTDEAAARGLDYGSTDHMVGVASGDLDGDRDYDLVIHRGVVTEIARNDGTGNYTLEMTSLPSAESGFGQALNLGDIDDDGDLDIVLGGVPGLIGVKAAIGINDGTGSFADESDMRWDENGKTGTIRGQNAKLFDVDYDGDLDWVMLHNANFEQGVMQHSLHVLLNDGAGVFTYDNDHSMAFPAMGSALGADADITDLDGDGSYDVWAGAGGDRVRILLNSHVDPDGLPADVPRNLTVQAVASDAVTIRWDPPPFAATARGYRVYRATAAALERGDRTLIRRVGQRHQDEGFADPITRHMTTADLGQSGVALDAGSVELSDSSVEPGVTYFYTVTHVGTENTESVIADEVAAAVPDGGGSDGDGPTIAIISPTDQTWSAYPRIVVQFADPSGVDPASVRISFDQDLGDPASGGRPAGADLSDLVYRLDGGVAVIPILPPLELPDQAFATLTVDVGDTAGNMSTEQASMFVAVTAAQRPGAAFDATPAMGEAPLVVDFDASASTDPDGKLLRWEWYFGDGTTGLGRLASHTYGAGGVYTARLVARDNDGGVSTITKEIDVTGPPPECDLGETRQCYTGPDGTQDVGECRGGLQVCQSLLWGECDEVVPEDEVCDDGVDNDCDGATDADDMDCGGSGSGSGTDGDSDDGGTGTDGDDGGAEGGAGDGSSSGCGCTNVGARGRWWLLVMLVVGHRRRTRDRGAVA